jgi:hypothetical protein
MNDHLRIDAAGDDAPSELDWLADRFVLGELSAADEQAILDRLAADDELAAAIARSSRMLAALRATPAASVRPTAARSGRRLALAVSIGGLAAALALVACWPAIAPRRGMPDGGPREVVRLWRQADEAVWSAEEPLAEDETVDVDAVPDWMLAAVGLDAAPALDPGVQEN